MPQGHLLDEMAIRVLRVIRSQNSAADEPRLVAVIDAVLNDTKGIDSEEKEAMRLRLIHRLVPSHDDSDYIRIFDEFCDCGQSESPCKSECEIDAIGKDDNGRLTIDRDKCVDCGRCVSICTKGAISNKTQCVELINLLRNNPSVPVYAILAPSFAGQLDPDASSQQINAAMKQLGFTDTVEVAMAADIMTIREADEYIERYDHGKGFMITSCCCPAFVKLVEKHRPALNDLVSPSISPMIACGRLLKSKEPEAKVVFIGPCLAKKAEARLEDLKDAVDLVMTFKEVNDILSASDTKPSELCACESNPLFHASHDGRGYAYSSGVTEAISNAVRRKRPDIEIVGVIGNGLKECSEILRNIEAGKIKANFMEGMACPGGCVGGPGTVIPVEKGENEASNFAKKAEPRYADENLVAIAFLNDYGKDVDFTSKKLQMSVH